MITQSQIKPFTLFDLILSYLLPDSTPGTLSNATSLDYGFDFDGEQLAEELITPLPANHTDQSIPSIEAEEFDRLYKWFIS